MTEVTIIRERFSDWDDAAAARGRLTDHGFSRNSVDIRHVDDEVELTVHTQPHNRQRAEQVIHESSWTHGAHRYGRQLYEQAPSRGQTFLLFGALAATGAALWWAFDRNTQDWTERQSGRSRRDGRFMATNRDRPSGREHAGSGVTGTSTTSSRNSMAAGLGTERVQTTATSDDDRLRTASGAVPLGTTATAPSAGGIGSAAASGLGRSAEGVGSTGDGATRPVR
jgi:hypothetical protein